MYYMKIIQKHFWQKFAILIVKKINHGLNIVRSRKGFFSGNNTLCFSTLVFVIMCFLSWTNNSNGMVRVSVILFLLVQNRLLSKMFFTTCSKLPITEHEIYSNTWIDLSDIVTKFCRRLWEQGKLNKSICWCAGCCRSSFTGIWEIGSIGEILMCLIYYAIKWLGCKVKDLVSRLQLSEKVLFNIFLHSFVFLSLFTYKFLALLDIALLKMEMIWKWVQKSLRNYGGIPAIWRDPLWHSEMFWRMWYNEEGTGLT